MGLSVLTIQDIFDYMRRDDENEYLAYITYVEIYNESIRDLLVSQSGYLELRDDPIKVFYHFIIHKGHNYCRCHRIQSRVYRLGDDTTSSR